MRGQRRRLMPCGTLAAAARMSCPILIECALADATLGETVDVMREEFGVYEEPLIV